MCGSACPWAKTLLATLKTPSVSPDMAPIVPKPGNKDANIRIYTLYTTHDRGTLCRQFL